MPALSGPAAGQVESIMGIISTMARGQPYPLRVGIDGFCAAGKTTLANLIEMGLEKSGLKIVRATTDDFLSPPHIRWQFGESSPTGFFLHSINRDALVKRLLRPLGPGGNRRAFLSCDDSDETGPGTVVPAGSILLLDGIFLHSDPIREHLDYSIYVHADYPTCVDRAMRRQQEGLSPEETRRLYLERYAPGWDVYVRACNPASVADVVVPNPDASTD